MANRKITDLVALTAPATGDLLPIVDISEAAAADKNKKITFGELLSSAPDGSAAAPSFSFDSDPNTGIYSPGADQLAISTGGTGRLFVSSAGLVGIGTSSPSGILHTKTAGGEGFRLQGTDTADFIRFTNASDTSTAYIGHNTTFDIFNQRSTDMRFGTGDVERLRITSAGLVGIGTSAPQTALHVAGTTDGDQLRISQIGQVYKIGRRASDGSLMFTGLQTSFTAFRFGTDGNEERVVMDSSGRLLVGTSTSTSVGGSAGTVQVFGTSSNPHGLQLTRSDAPILSFGKTDVGGGLTLGALIFAGNDGSDVNSIGANILAQIDGTIGVDDMPGRLVFSTTADGSASPTERMRIDNAGRVLVGTSTANTSGAKLQTSDGLTFPATQVASSDPNTLDDYEEGTWTFQFYDAASAGNVSSTTGTGYYTKIGDKVTCNFVGVNINTSSMTSGNVLYFTLPFTSSSTKGIAIGSSMIENIDVATGTVGNCSTINANNARGYIILSSDNAGATTVNVGNVISGAGDVWVTITYSV